MRFRQHQDQARTATRRLLLLFLLTVLLTVLAVNLVLALLWSLQTGNLLAYPRWFFETNSVVCAAFILGGSWLETVQLRRGGAHVAEMVGAQELLVPRDGHQQRLRNVVQEMAIASGLKPPRIFLLDRDDSINAFAAGWEQNDSVIAVTRGAIERLTRDELQGVVAHEFSHILHGDTRLNMRLIGHVWGLQLLFLLGRDLFDATDAHGRRTAFVLMGLGLMAVGSIGWLAGRLLKAAVSRQREFLADASAVQYTRLPSGIGGALRKLAGQTARGPAPVRSSRAEVISHMLLSSDLFAGAGALATHPPLAERIRRIYGRAMAPLGSDVLAQAPVASVSNSIDMGMAFDAAVGVAAQPAGAASAVVLEPGTEPQPDPVALAAAAVDHAPVSRQNGGWLDELLAIAWPYDLVPATLAFLVPPDGTPERQAWRAQCAGPGAAYSDFLLRQTWHMAPSQRLAGFERLLTRCASLPMPERAQMRRQAHAIVRADGRLMMPELWQCLLLDHMLELRHVSVLRETRCLSLVDCAPAVACMTEVLVTQRFSADAGRADACVRWRDALCSALELPAWPAGSMAATPVGISAAVRHVARLSWMMRPRLMKAWCAVALSDGTGTPQPLADALRVLCRLIDTPMPPQLQACFPESATVP